LYIPPIINTQAYNIFDLVFFYTGIKYIKKLVEFANKCNIPACKNIAVNKRQIWPWFTNKLEFAPYFNNVSAFITDRLYLPLTISVI
jgi:hypothetical protein